MATYTKETALYDTGAIAGDIQEAGTTATSYLTNISGGGVYVHSADTPSDPTSSTAQGVQITDEVNIIRDGESVAVFGETVRIGEKDVANIAIASSNLSGYGAGHREFFNFGDSENTMTVTRYHGWSRRPVSEYPYTDDGAFSASVPSSSALSRLEVTFAFTTAGVDARIEFTSGTAATKTVTVQYNNVSYTFSAYYNGIDMVSSIKLTSRHTEQGVSIGTDIIYDETIIAPYYELGVNVDATGNIAYAEGFETIAGGDYSHAEGNRSEASGVGSHAEGYATIADGNYSHAGGVSSRANSSYSHASGMYVIANGRSQTVIGEYNEADTLNKVARSANAFIIGNGSDNLNRSNALEVDWSGNVNAGGSITAYGHNTPIGYANSGTGTKSLTSGNSAVKISGDLSLAAGTLILIGDLSFPANATGNRNIRWYVDGADISASVVTVPATTGGYITRIQSIAVVNSNESMTANLYGWQNSGSTQSVTYYWQLVRIA